MTLMTPMIVIFNSVIMMHYSRGMLRERIRDRFPDDSSVRDIGVCSLSIPVTNAPNQTLLPSDGQKCSENHDWRDRTTSLGRRYINPLVM